MPRLLPLCLSWLLLYLAGSSFTLAAAQETSQDGFQAQVEEIRIEGAPGREAEILGAIQQQVGGNLDSLGLTRSQEWLWKYKRIRVDSIEQLPGTQDGSLILVFHVTPLTTWRRAVFLGNEEFERAELELWAGLFGQSLDTNSVEIIRQRLLDRYREEGYAHVAITREQGEEDEVVFRIDEGPEVTIEKVIFEGNEAIRDGAWYVPGLDIYENLQGTTGGLFAGSPFSPLRVSEDVNAIANLYRDYGYLGVQVSSDVRFEGNELDEAVVTYRIVEGPLYTVRSVEIRSADGNALRFPMEELRAETRLQVGDPFEKSRIDVDRLALQKLYSGFGYPSAARVHRILGGKPVTFLSVGGSNGGAPDTLVDASEPVVDVVFVISEGKPRRLRDIVIRGNRRTQDRVIRREIQLEPGDPVDETDALRSYRRLTGLGYFRDENRQPYVNWFWQDVGDPELLDLVFEVKDIGSNNRLRFGGSWNSDNGPSLLIDLTKTNFDITDTPSSFGSTLAEIWNGSAFTGAGQTLNLSLRPGTVFSSYAISFTEPDLLAEHISRLSLNVTGRKNLRLFPTHDEERSQVGFTLGRRFGRYFTVFAGPEAQVVKLDDIDPGAPSDLTDFAGSNDLNTFTLGARYNTVEDPFSPVDGINYALFLGQSGGFMGGDWDYLKATLRTETYFPLWQDSLGRPWTLGLNGRVRKAFVSDSLGNLPYPEKFYLGGQSSIRGFNFRGVGEDPNGFSIGGDVSWDASLELRFPLVSTRQRGLVDEFEMVRGGVFLDAGALGNDFGNLDSTRVSAGFAMRMRFAALPTAPLSLDFAWPLQSEDGDDTRVFSFTIGNF
ncbi:MAG: BamA/OMP85 family outer membrane protein [Planctomycetota bacterium]